MKLSLVIQDDRNQITGQEICLQFTSRDQNTLRVNLGSEEKKIVELHGHNKYLLSFLSSKEIFQRFNTDAARRILKLLYMKD